MDPTPWMSLCRNHCSVSSWCQFSHLGAGCCCCSSHRFRNSTSAAVVGGSQHFLSISASWKNPLSCWPMLLWLCCAYQPWEVKRSLCQSSHRPSLVPDLLLQGILPAPLFISLVTVLEVVPKEKKKPEKITPLGQAVVDLLPLLQGTTLSFTASVTTPCSLALSDLCLWIPDYNSAPLDTLTFIALQNLTRGGRGREGSSALRIRP